MSYKSKEIFQQLEEWSLQKDVYSINEFLKKQDIPINEFEQMANGSKRFMKIWETAETLAWENLKKAILTKSLPRSQIANYIKQDPEFKDQDPEEVIQNIEQERQS